jgi:hypothetical protein
MRTARSVWPKKAKWTPKCLEALLALGGEPVDDLRPLAVEGGGGDVLVSGVVLDQEALSDQALEAGIERPVREGAERSQQHIEAFAQLVAVHGGVVQQAEDGELKDAGAPAHALLPPLPGGVCRLDV